jgi:hypothetical protein
MSVCDSFTDGDGRPVTSCSCPVTMSFTSLAPGNWNVAAGGANCSANVKPGQISTVQMFTDGRPCTKFP